ncbi:MAG: hypothetical protein K1X29_00535 [Bdellovibrionales bacterium]|nr:hypothetical protein [Bdellovibrionales bacterium]
MMKLIDDSLEEESSAPHQENSSYKKSTTKAVKETAAHTFVVQPKTTPVSESPLPKLAPEEPKDDATMKLNESKILNVSDDKPGNNPTFSHSTDLQGVTVRGKLGTDIPSVKASVGRYSPLRSGGFSSATEAALASSENLRIAQNRILELEQEISRLRTENEQLGAAGETFRRLADELQSQSVGLQGKMDRSLEQKDHEIELLHKSLNRKEKEMITLKSKNEEFEVRLKTNIQKIRVRERELENRLELVKMESSALIRNKDEMILDLKRQLDQSHMELENYRDKGHELNKQLDHRQEKLRRTVKALRIALSMLEDEDDASNQKKGK